MYGDVQVKRNRCQPPLSPRGLCGISDTATKKITSIARAGADIRYEITPQLRIIGTVNPDFENIEQAVEGIDFSYLAKSLALHKKVLGLYHNHDLAREQADAAARMGFTAYTFRGRGSHFGESKLAAIPLKSRKHNETLFRKHGVMCPVYDEVEKYQKKRLNVYNYCNTCPLYDACQTNRYWAQFDKARTADFLAVCMQDLLFNPGLQGFLETLLKGRVDSDAAGSLEDAAIGAMLGCHRKESETVGSAVRGNG